MRIEEQLTGIDRRMDERFTSTQWLIGIMVTPFMAVNTAVQVL